MFAQYAESTNTAFEPVSTSTPTSSNWPVVTLYKCVLHKSISLLESGISTILWMFSNTFRSWLARRSLLAWCSRTMWSANMPPQKMAKPRCNISNGTKVCKLFAPTSLLVGRLVAWLVGWLVVWLVVWLVGWCHTCILLKIIQPELQVLQDLNTQTRYN